MRSTGNRSARPGKRPGTSMLCTTRGYCRWVILLVVGMLCFIFVARFRLAATRLRRGLAAGHDVVGGTADDGAFGTIVPPRTSMTDAEKELEDVLRRKGTEFPTRLFHYIPAEPPQRLRNNTSRDAASSVPVPDGVCLDCYELVSLHPRVYLFRNIVSASEAAALRELGEPLLSRSGVFAKQSIQRNVRSSYGARLPNDNPTSKALNDRLLYILNNFSSDKATRTFRSGYSERLELLKYEGSQNYYGHVDNFGGLDGPLARQRRQRMSSLRTKVASLEAAQRSTSQRNQHAVADASMCKAILNDWRDVREPLLDRGATMIVFLNDLDPAAPGGHTAFPFAAAGYNRSDVSSSDDASPTAREQWRRMLQSFRTSKDDACGRRSEPMPASEPSLDSTTRENGDANRSAPTGASPEFLKVKPVLGHMLLFYDLYENGVSDPFALHAGCPPIREDELAALANKMARVLPPGIANASEVRSRLEKQFTKTVVTKWFMLPIVGGVSKPERCAQR